MRSGEAGDEVGEDGVGLDRCPPPLLTPPPTKLFSLFANLFTCVEPPPPFVRPANEEVDDVAETSEAGLERAVGDDVEDEEEVENMGDMMMTSLCYVRHHALAIHDSHIII